MLDQALATFGQRMGLPNLSFTNNIVALDVDKLGRLHFEKHSHANKTELLIYLARSKPAYDRQLAEKVLRHCHYLRPRPYSLVAGIHGEHLLLLTRLAENVATPAEIEKAIIFLSEQMNLLNPSA